VIDNLSTFSKIKGGRLRSSSLVLKSRSAQMREHDIHPSSLLAMVPSLVASSIGAGWKPQPQSGSLADPGGADPSRSTVALWTDHVQIHPDTPDDDPLVRRFGRSQSPGLPSERGHSPAPSDSSSPVSHRGGRHSRAPSSSSLRPPSVEPISEEGGGAPASPSPRRARSSTLQLPLPSSPR
jgi:Ca2+-transporting ATPase